MIDQNNSNIVNGIKLSVVEISKMQKFKNCITRGNVNKGEEQKTEDTVRPTNEQCSRLRPPYLTMFVSEFLGTGLLMFLGCMGCISNFDKDAPHHFGSLTFGLAVMAIIQTFGHISGAHLNPAVTIATVLFGQVEIVMGVVYIIAQFVGATLGYGLLIALAPEEYVPDGFCATTIHPKISIIQALAIETVITTFLILVCCAVWDKRNSSNTDSTSLRFGFVIAMISMAAGPLTGASMNTARSFAPLAFGGSWENHWIYWVGPNLAAFLGWGIYKFFFSLPEDDEENKTDKDEIISLETVQASAGEKV